MNKIFQPVGEALEGLAESAKRQITGTMPPPVPEELPEKPVPTKRVVDNIAQKAEQLRKIQLENTRRRLAQLRMPNNPEPNKLSETRLPRGKTRGDLGAAQKRSQQTGEFGKIGE